jgi:hypothetical protein
MDNNIGGPEVKKAKLATGTGCATKEIVPGRVIHECFVVNFCYYLYCKQL